MAGYSVLPTWREMFGNTGWNFYPEVGPLNYDIVGEPMLERSRQEL